MTRAKQCHGYPLPCSLQNRALCIDQATADAVYRLGNWECVLRQP